MSSTIIRRVESVPMDTRHIAVAVVFGICGALSATHLLSSGRLTFPNRVPTMLPVPFALLCALLFLHKLRAVLAVPLIIAVWPIAYYASFYLGLVSGPLLFPACVGGFIGGLGLVLCVSVCYRPLLSAEYVFRGAKIGAVSALAFVPWLWSFFANLNSGDPPQWLLTGAFAIWQAAVGTYLYAICYRADYETKTTDSS